MDRVALEAFVRRWTNEAIAEGRIDAFDQLLAEEVIDRSGPVPSQGREVFKARSAAVRVWRATS
jgi:hypothetical protein